MSIDDIIRKAGDGDFGDGCRRLALASERSPKPIGADAVRKWSLNGIPDVHWPAVMRLAGVTIEQIYSANVAIRHRGRRRSHHAAA